LIPRAARREYLSNLAHTKENDVSVYVSLRIKADRSKFEELANGEWNDRLLQIAQRGKSMGAIHHRFATTDGEIVVIDEWESREQFERFFNESTDIAEFMQAVGVQSQPEISFLEPLSVGDEF
jgi:heme-degrading monooxygenase HmoA